MSLPKTPENWRVAAGKFRATAEKAAVARGLFHGDAGNSAWRWFHLKRRNGYAAVSVLQPPTRMTLPSLDRIVYGSVHGRRPRGSRLPSTGGWKRRPLATRCSIGRP